MMIADGDPWVEVHLASATGATYWSHIVLHPVEWS